MSLAFKPNYNGRVLNLENEYDIRRELRNLNVDSKAYDILLNHMNFKHIKLDQVDTRAANIIKQKINKIGGEAAISREAYSYTERSTDIIISGSKKNLLFLAKKLASESYGLGEISKEIERCLDDSSGIFKLKNRVFDFNHRTYIMGALDFQKYIFSSVFTMKGILNKVERFLKCGADVIDICCENMNRSAFNKLLKNDIIEKVIPMIHKIKNEFPEIVLSIDTSNELIAREAIGAGIDFVNTIMPLKYNLEIIKLISKSKCPIILMHNPAFRVPAKPLVSISETLREIQSNVFFAMSNGVSKNDIIIDPGICFGRNEKDNFLILRQLSGFRHLHNPIIVTLSQHSFLGDALRGRLRTGHISSIVSNTIAIIKSANLIRLYKPNHVTVMSNIISTINHSTEHDDED